MKGDRSRQLRDDYRKALGRLKEAVGENLSKGSIVIDGAIQRFEFTFELAWKFLRSLLQFQGIEANSPRSAIKSEWGQANILIYRQHPLRCSKPPLAREVLACNSANERGSFHAAHFNEGFFRLRTQSRR